MRMRWTVGRRIAAGFTLSLLIALTLGAVSYRAARNSLDLSRRVTQQDDILRQIEVVLSTMKDAETGQRGFSLTGVDQFLEPYTAASLRVNGEMQALRQVTGTDAIQTRRLDSVDTRIRQKFAEMQTVIDTRRAKGIDAAIAIIKTERGK